MTKPENKNSSLPADAKRERRRRASEACATVGLLLVCAGLVAPFVSFDNEVLLEVFKWVYMAGAVIFTVARLFNVNDPGDGVRVKRIRRMEGWAGICFCVGAGFWIYNAQRFGGIGFSLAVMRDTIVFTLAGALLQIISSWMLYYALKKQEKQEKQ